VRFSVAVDTFLADMAAQGRINSRGSEEAYRKTLLCHAEDVLNRDPRYTGREDVKDTLRRWPHPNTQANRRAILVSFYDWLMEEGYRKDNPARQTRRPRKRKSQVYRMTLDEARRMLEAARTGRERRAVFIGICAGLRSQELRGLRGRHFDRPGWVWVSRDIGKGGRERWVPVIPDLEPVVAEVQEHVGQDEYLLPAQKVWNLEPERPPKDLPDYPCSPQALWRLVERVGRRAGIVAHIHPHLLRHAYGDHIARYAGMRNAQFLLGHADVATTETYVGAPTLDDLAHSIEGFSFGANERSRGAALTPQTQQYRHGDSNPGLRLAGVLERLFASPALRAAAKDMIHA
jgi:integrase/recombinase XerD